MPTPMNSRSFKSKVCAFSNCENVFQPQQTTTRFCGQLHERKCAEPLCELMTSGRTESSTPLKCRSCRKEESKLKRKATMLERYGVAHVSQDESAQHRKLETVRARYGVDNPSQIEEVKLKKISTTLSNYNVRNPSQSSEIKDRKRVTTLANFGVDNPLKLPENRELAKVRLEHSLATGQNRSSRISQVNRYWAQLIEKELKVRVSFEKSLGSASFDLQIADSPICIDINPTFSHNSAVSYHCGRTGCKALPCDKHSSTLVPSDYHLKRAALALSNSVDLVQIYDWDSETATLELLESKLSSAKQSHTLIVSNRSAYENTSQAVGSKVLSLDKHLDRLLAKGVYSLHGFNVTPQLYWAKRKELIVSSSALSYLPSDREVVLDSVRPTGTSDSARPTTKPNSLSAALNSESLDWVELINRGFRPVWTSGSICLS